MFCLEQKANLFHTIKTIKQSLQTVLYIWIIKKRKKTSKLTLLKVFQVDSPVSFTVRKVKKGIFPGNSINKAVDISQ